MLILIGEDGRDSWTENWYCWLHPEINILKFRKKKTHAHTREQIYRSSSSTVKTVSVKPAEKISKIMRNFPEHNARRSGTYFCIYRIITSVVIKKSIIRRIAAHHIYCLQRTFPPSGLPRPHMNFCDYHHGCNDEIRMPKEKALDWAWVHGTTVVEGDYKCVKCNYCLQVLRGGVTSLKKHLARIQGCCPSVPKAVMDGCRENFEETGPDKIMKLKSSQKKVPLCEGHIDDSIVEEPERTRKNGKAVDSAWLHGTAVAEGNFRQVRCNYCLKVINSYITGLKKHLARIGVGVKACPSVPQAVSDGFRENFEESGPNKTWTLKRNQKMVPLCEGQSGNPTNVNTDDGTPEEYGEQSANAGPTPPVTKCQSSASNSGHSALVKGMSNSRGKAGKEVAERVAERLKVNLTKRDRSQVKTRTHSAQIFEFTPIINVEDSSSDDETGPNTSLTDTLSKKRRTDDAFDPHHGLHSSDTSRPSTHK